MGAKQKNLIGERFNRLCVIDKLESHVSKGGWKKRRWLCICDCGGKTTATTSSLEAGDVTSCGCYHSELSVQNSLKSRHKIYKTDAGFNVVKGRYRSNAIKRGLSFNLSDEELQILFTGNCYYCGTTKSNVYDKAHYNFEYNGIDRVDNSIGYSLDNCVSCCKICNHAKATMSQEEFLSWINRISNHQRLKQEFQVADTK